MLVSILMKCKSYFIYEAIVTGTHHGGGNADVQMVHASRWVVVVQVVVHMLMRALPATQHHTLMIILKPKPTPGARLGAATDHTSYI
jgi:hypothetical protein